MFAANVDPNIPSDSSNAAGRRNFEVFFLRGLEDGPSSNLSTCTLVPFWSTFLTPFGRGRYAKNPAIVMGFRQDVVVTL